jgi:hypothetical protein
MAKENAIRYIVKAVGEPDEGNLQALLDDGVLSNSRTLLYPREKRLPIMCLIRGV